MPEVTRFILPFMSVRYTILYETIPIDCIEDKGCVRDNQAKNNQ